MSLALTSDAVLVAAFSLVALFLLLFDLGVFQRTPREPTFQESVRWSLVWIALAVLFGVGVTVQRGTDDGMNYFSAYLLEKALSVDNMLVLIAIFAQFGIPGAARRKALAAGVIGAVVFRAIFIVGGTSLVTEFHVLTYVLGAVLVITAIKIARGGLEDAGSPKMTMAERLARRVLPVSRTLDGSRFFTRELGRFCVTPLFVAVIVIEITDVIFAVDSIPAVLAITSDPFIALTSNLFAILGLRALFFVVAGMLARLRYLQIGLVIVLMFIGVKMLVSFAIKVPVYANLAVIGVVLGTAVIASVRAEARERSRV